MNPNTTSTEPFTPASCSAPVIESQHTDAEVPVSKWPVHQNLPAALLELAMWTLKSHARYGKMRVAAMCDPELAPRQSGYSHPEYASNKPLPSQIGKQKGYPDGWEAFDCLPTPEYEKAEIGGPIMDGELLCGLPPLASRFPIDLPDDLLCFLAHTIGKDSKIQRDHLSDTDISSRMEGKKFIESVEVKAELVRRGGALRYQNQMAMVYPDNNIYGWVASPSDCLEKDWCIHEEAPSDFTPAPVAETAGTAKPL